MEIVLSQPTPSPQWYTSPRRAAAVDTLSVEPGTPQAESQSTDREGIFPHQASVGGTLHTNCTSPAQECILPSVGVDDEEKPSSSEQVAACEGFASPPRKRQQQRMTTWTSSKASSLILEVDRETITFLSTGMSCRVYCLLVFVVFLSCFSLVVFLCLVCNFPKQVREARRAIEMPTRCMNKLMCQDRSAHHRLDLHQQRIYSVLRCSFVCLMICRFWYRFIDDW